MRPTTPDKSYQQKNWFARMDTWSSCLLLQKAQHLPLATLHHTNKLLITRTARLPPLHDIVPCTGALLEQPAFGPGIEMGRERTIDHIFFLSLVIMGRHLQLKLITQRDGSGHPDLAQFIVAMSLKAVVKLLTVFLQVIGQSKPLDREHKHPVNGPLQLFMPAVGLVKPAHALLTMAQVEGFFLVYFDEGSFPGTESRTLIHITEQSITRPVIKSIGDNKFYPAIQRHIKGIGIFELARFALKYQFFGVYA